MAFSNSKIPMLKSVILFNYQANVGASFDLSATLSLKII